MKWIVVNNNSLKKENRFFVDKHAGSTTKLIQWINTNDILFSKWSAVSKPRPRRDTVTKEGGISIDIPIVWRYNSVIRYSRLFKTADFPTRKAYPSENLLISLFSFFFLLLLLLLLPSFPLTGPVLHPILLTF